MKKVGVLLTLLVMLSLFGLVLAADDDTATTDEDLPSDEEGFDLGYNCLETELKDDCSGASTIEELSLSILASTDDLGDACVSQLGSSIQNDECWGQGNRCNVKDTAMAILALKHAGTNAEDLEKSVSWLLAQNKTATDLIWYLQQNSDGEADCKFSHDSNPTGKIITAYDNKKLSSSAGSCLSLAVGSYWLKIAPTCYDQTFTVECNKDFLATLIYRQENSPVYYILDETLASPASGEISLSPKAYCFGEGNCDYMSTAWASLALLEAGYPIDDFIPYIIATEDTNKEYLPKAFSYIVTGDQKYAEDLIGQKGELNDYWLAFQSANNKLYDTSLAYKAISGFDGAVDTEVTQWIKDVQNEDGCWSEPRSSKIRDTAMILWSFEGRDFIGNGGNNGGDLPPRCELSGFWCVQEGTCEEANLRGNYFCGLAGVECCAEGPSCSEDFAGIVCEGETYCEGDTKKSVEGTCCLTECITAPEETACEIAGGWCRSECSDGQNEISEDCGDFSKSCCISKAGGSSNWWIWVLIILIILVVVAIGWVYREKLKLWWFKKRSGFKKDKGKKTVKPSTNVKPPRPGFPPVRRPPIPQQRMQHRAPSTPSPKSKKQLDDTFSKLKEMSK